MVDKKGIDPENIIPDSDGSISFWRPNEKNGVFSNFYRCNIKIDGVVWSTTEHYFQAMKFVGTDKVEVMRAMKTPSEVFQAGRERDPKYPLRSDWETARIDVMRKALYEKFTQVARFRQILEGTRDAKLIEASPRDAFWGTGKDGRGVNQLGILLMELREQLRNEAKNAIKQK